MVGKMLEVKMYNYKKDEIIQDITESKNKSSVFAIGKIYTQFINRIREWYENTDFEQAGHDTARFLMTSGEIIKKICKCLFTITGHAILWYPLILIVYCTFQFFLLFKGIRPEFINTWINSLDLTKFPVIFHENQGHPILLTYIYFVCIDYIIRTIRTICDYGFYSRYRDVWQHVIYNVEPLIFSVIFTYAIFQSWIYLAIGIFMVLCFLKTITTGKVPETQSFSLYDSKGNFVGRVEKN